MRIILKSFGTLNYHELVAVDAEGEHLLGHLTLTPEQRGALVTMCLRGCAPEHLFQTHLKAKPDREARQEGVDRLFEEATRGPGDPPPRGWPSGTDVRMPDRVEGFREIAEDKPANPVSIPDFGEHPLPPSRTEQLAVQLQGIPRVPGIDGTEQAAKIRAEQAKENARQGGAVRAGEEISGGPVSYPSEARFVPVRADSVRDTNYGWNVLDRQTGRYRMPGFVLDRDEAVRVAIRAEDDPEGRARNFVWECER